MNIRMDRLVRAARKLGTLPEIIQRIDDAINDPSSSLDDIARIITDDPVLAARTLRIANSSLFGFPTEISTITRALTVIGTQQLRDLVMATSIIQLFSSSTSSSKTRSFWCHSVACGLVARVLATFRREANVESFYLAGLLHDIGRLVLDMEYPGASNQLLQVAMEDGKQLHVIEREMFGFDHARVGGAILETWKLPPLIFQGIGFHHSPEMAGTYALEASLVHIADVIAVGMQLEKEWGMTVPTLSHEAWERIGLPATILRLAFRQVDNQYQDAVRVFLGDMGK